MFERAFKDFGLPRAIRTDNGLPFSSAHALYGLSQLSVWLRLDRANNGLVFDPTRRRFPIFRAAVAVLQQSSALLKFSEGSRKGWNENRRGRQRAIVTSSRRGVP